MKATVDIGYMVGHLRYGHIECDISDDFREEFLNMNKKEQQEYIIEEGEFIVDDYELDDYGDIGDVIIHN